MYKKKYIQDPDTLMQYFEEYRKDVKDNPRMVYEFHGRNGEERLKPLERPLTHEGFLSFVWDKYGIDINAYYYNVGQAYDDYLSICTRIKEKIRQDQIEGGMVGQYNASITQRLNGLVDKSEVTQKQEQPLFPD